MKQIVKKILFVALLIPFAITLSAQQYSAKDMVAITPLLPSEMELPEDAKRSLNLKLRQMVTQNGFGSYSNQFVLTGDMAVLDKQATLTAPAKYIVDVEFSFYVVNVVEKIIIDEIAFVLKGVDRMEHKAMIQAINQVKPRSQEVRNFMSRSREKIIEYYNTRIPTLVNKARSLSDRKQYREALAVLSAVPEMVDQYEMVAELMTSVYQDMIDQDGARSLTKAKSEIVLKDYEAALESLLAVNPASAHSDEALQLIESIGPKVEEREQKEIELKMKVYGDMLELYKREQDLDEARIEAAKEVGISQNEKEGEMVKALFNSWYNSRH